jgi:N-methylhydantoinase A
MAVLGVDVGGTFTDFYLWRDGALQVYKRPSTPAAPAEAVIAGLAETGWRPQEVVHGSTVATNAVLERRGARTAFVTSEGFRDLLTIGRQARSGLYDLNPRRPPPLVPRALCFEAPERVDVTGAPLRRLSRRQARAVARRVAAAGVEAVAVCLLFSFLYPDHESLLGEELAAAGLDASLSSEVLPEMREYERASTTCLNAYVAPVTRRYLRALADGLAERGVEKLLVMQSSGGTATAEGAAALPVSTLLSGPAGGVAGAFALARAAGFDRVITLDMGGTSTDVALCDGAVPFTTEWEVSGLPVRVPSVHVHTVGAGGGSIAWRDAGGALRAGPASAGADPGPACYGRGGPATVTDAHLALGRVSGDWFLGGGLHLDAAAAGDALAGLGLGDAATAARGVLQVANAGMERALRVVSVQRGHDPRDFTLFAFGGAGPLHACDLARALSVRRVLVPRYPGVLSAMGMALADRVGDAAIAFLRALPPAGDEREALRAEAEAAFRAMEGRLRREVGEAAGLERGADLRYAGQGYEVTVPWSEGGLDAVGEAFHEAHLRLYGHAARDRPVELVALRLRARLPRRLPPWPSAPDAGPDPLPALLDRRSVVFDREHETPVYGRDGLRPGNLLRGPALVAQMDSTTAVPPGWRAAVDGLGNLLLEEA